MAGPGLSIGAGRSRIVRQLLTESLLALAGGAAGVAVAHWAFRAIVALAPEAVRLAKTSLDGRVLAFAFGVSVLIGVLFGLAPAFAGIRSTGARFQRKALDISAAARRVSGSDGSWLLVRSRSR